LGVDLLIARFLSSALWQSVASTQRKKRETLQQFRGWSLTT